MRDKVVSAAEAVAIIRPGDMVATSGFVGVGTPDAIFVALEERFLATGQPRDLGLLFAAAPGDGKEKGLNRLAHDGLIRRAVGGHWSLVPKLGKMAADGLIEAWNLPLGCVSQLFREIAGRRPGLLSRVGIGTFVDPRHGGGKLNAISVQDLVRVMEIDGQEWLFYQAIPVDVAIIRGTTADPDGNISMEREALILDNLAIAMAAKASKGFVIAQVERLAAADALPAKQVVVPGVLVDCVVLAPAEHHAQTYATAFSPAFSGQLRVPLDRIPPLALDERKIIARRCAMELPMGGVVNLGIGMPEAVAAVAKEENLLQQVTLTAEPGIIGGLPQGGLDFGAAINPSAIIAQNQQFDFYDGGGLDLACLGMAQADGQGNVNVSRFGGRFAGAGGFINITQNARALVFAGTFTAGGLRVEAGEGTLRIAQEGRSHKFVAAVEQVTFNGQLAASAGQTGALCHRALRVPADARRSGPGGGGAGHRSGAGHPGPDGFSPDRRRSQADGRAAVPRGGDGPRGHAARPPAGRPVRLRPGPIDPVHRFCRLPRAAHGAGRGGARAGALPGRAARPQGRRRHRL